MVFFILLTLSAPFGTLFGASLGTMPAQATEVVMTPSSQQQEASPWVESSDDLAQSQALEDSEPAKEPKCLTFYKRRYFRSYHTEKVVKKVLYSAGALAYTGGAFVWDGFWFVGGVISIVAWAVEIIDVNHLSYTLLKDAHEIAKKGSAENILESPDSTFHQFFYPNLDQAVEIAGILDKALLRTNEGPCQLKANGTYRFMTAKAMRKYVNRALEAR